MHSGRTGWGWASGEAVLLVGKVGLVLVASHHNHHLLKSPSLPPLVLVLTQCALLHHLLAALSTICIAATSEKLLLHLLCTSLDLDAQGRAFLYYYCEPLRFRSVILVHTAISTDRIKFSRIFLCLFVSLFEQVKFCIVALWAAEICADKWY